MKQNQWVEKIWRSRSSFSCCIFVAHLEQSCPLQPEVQLHLFGLMHLPPFRQGDEHTAAEKGKRHSYSKYNQVVDTSSLARHDCFVQIKKPIQRFLSKTMTTQKTGMLNLQLSVFNELRDDQTITVVDCSL